MPFQEDPLAKYRADFSKRSEELFKPRNDKVEKPDLSLKKLVHSDGKPERPLYPGETSEDELNRQIKMSLDDYTVSYEQRKLEGKITDNLPQFEGMQIHFAESEEQVQLNTSLNSLQIL